MTSEQLAPELKMFFSVMIGICFLLMGMDKPLVGEMSILDKIIQKIYIFVAVICFIYTLFLLIVTY
ncbi:MAG: hypothetical protein KAQ64_04825 [Candidatus Pacebacteria bacterium]|nr:hypothetical protein [Candidatus Paceibacterota bacterium]